MRYQGSEAYSMDVAERRRERLEQRAAPSFEVVTGGGLDARARAGVSPTFVARLRVALVAFAVLVAVGMVRVGISAATVTFLSANSTLSAQIDESTNLNDQLRVQRSVLSSNARISRIAAQNYGMVLTADSVTVDRAPEEGAAAADGEAAQTADAAAAESPVS